MDLLKEYAKEHEKVNIRNFFRLEYESVHLYNTQIEFEDKCWEGLRNHWMMIVDEFAINYPNKKVSTKQIKLFCILIYYTYQQHRF